MCALTTSMTLPSKRVQRLLLAYGWVAFGIAGITEYLGWWDMPFLHAKIANSIPIIFLISVYANFSTDKDRAEGTE